MSATPCLLADGSSKDDAESAVTIALGDPIDRMRYRCPNNHTRWVPSASCAYCKTCAELHDIDPRYNGLRDAKTGETIRLTIIEFLR